MYSLNNEYVSNSSWKINMIKLPKLAIYSTGHTCWKNIPYNHRLTWWLLIGQTMFVPSSFILWCHWRVYLVIGRFVNYFITSCFLLLQTCHSLIILFSKTRSSWYKPSWVWQGIIIIICLQLFPSCFSREHENKHLVDKCRTGVRCWTYNIANVAVKLIMIE